MNESGPYEAGGVKVTLVNAVTPTYPNPYLILERLVAETGAERSDLEARLIRHSIHKPSLRTFLSGLDDHTKDAAQAILAECGAESIKTSVRATKAKRGT